MHGPVVHVDTAERVPASLQTGGARYQATAPAEPLPTIHCPVCDGSVTGVKVGTPPYLRTFTDQTFGTPKKDRTLPPCPVPGFSTEILFWTAEPCGCRVSTIWAGGFTAEKNRRLAGLSPQPVRDISQQQKERENRRLTKALSDLYGLQMTAEGDAKLAVDYWIVVIADQLQRLNPGKHNAAATPRSLQPEVQGWANKNGHAMPVDPVDPFGVNPQPGSDYGSDYPMPSQYRRRNQTDQQDAVDYALAATFGAPRTVIPAFGIPSDLLTGAPGTPMMRIPETPPQIELPDTVIAQVISVLDHRGNSDEVVGVLNLMLEQGGKVASGSSRIDLLRVIRRHLVNYQADGTKLHPNAYYFVTTLLDYVDLGHPGTTAIPVMRPKPAPPGKLKLPTSQLPTVDKLARKRRTIRRLNPGDGKS